MVIFQMRVPECSTFQYINIDVVSWVPGSRDAITSTAFCFPAGLFIEEAACLQIIETEKPDNDVFWEQPPPLLILTPSCISELSTLSGCESSSLMGVMQLWPSTHIALLTKWGFLSREYTHSQETRAGHCACDFKAYACKSSQVGLKKENEDNLPSFSILPNAP